MWPFKKPCAHWDTYHTFMDLHRGADGEMYFRHYTTCRQCGKRWASAPRIPDIIAKAIDANLEIGRLTWRAKP